MDKHHIEHKGIEILKNVPDNDNTCSLVGIRSLDNIRKTEADKIRFLRPEAGSICKVK
jgi:hypothetical protein